MTVLEEHRNCMQDWFTAIVAVCDIVARVVRCTGNAPQPATKLDADREFPT